MQAGSWAQVVSPRYAAPAAMFTIGIGLHAFNAFIASTTMPSAALELDAVALLSWATSAYLVASIVGGAAAVLRARLGARPLLLASSLAFIGGSLAFGLADATAPLVAGRILQGAGEGIVMACCYALIPEIFPKALVPRIFALESVVWAVAALAGPLLAGVVSEFVSWRVAVMMSAPLSLVFMALVPLCVPAGTNGNRRAAAMPLAQLALIAFGVFLLSASEAVEYVSLAVGVLAAGVVTLALALIIDERAPSRLFPPRAFVPTHPVGAGLLLVLLLCIVEAPSVVFVAFTGRTVWGMNAMEAGFLSAIVAMSWSVTAIGVAHMPRLAAVYHVLPAPALLAAGLALQAFGLSVGSLAAAIVAQILIGAAFGFSWARLCEQVMDTAAPAERDFAMGAIPTIQSAGLSVGTALFGAGAGWFGLEAGAPAAQIVAVVAPLFAVAAVVAVALTPIARRVA
jgi:MFS family permease